MSADPEQEYFCDGLAEDLIDALAKLPGLRVVGNSSSFRFRGKGHDLQEIGQRLTVNTILEGSVRKAAKRLRINAQLVNAEDGYQVWSERYDRELDDVFDVQDDIARSVVERLKVELLGEPNAPLVKRHSNLNAYQLLLRGRHSLVRGTPEGYAQAFEFLNLALVEQPDYAEALAMTAWVYAWQAILGWRSPRELWPKAQASARQSVALDERLADAHGALAAGLFWYDWNWAEAEREFRRSLARIIHEEADYSRKTNAPVWYKGCAHRPFATTEALA